MSLQTSDPRVIWEFINHNIRKLTTLYSKERAKHRRESKVNLEKGVKFYEDNLNTVVTQTIRFWTSIEKQKQNLR